MRRVPVSSAVSAPAVTFDPFVHELLDALMTFFSNDKHELLDALLTFFSNDKPLTIREVACNICKIVLERFNERFPDDRIDICALFGYFDWLRILKLKGAAGFQPYNIHRETIQVGAGLIGQVAEQKKSLFTKDLKNDSLMGNEVEQALTKLADKVALLVHPLLLANGQLVGVMVLGQFNSATTSMLFMHSAFTEVINKLTKHIATIYYHEILVVKANLSKRYVVNERHMTTTAMQFYRDTSREIDPKKFMEIIALESMELLNAGNPENPFYTNYLLYEYQEYRGQFVLTSFKKKPKLRYLRKRFSLNHKLYKEYVKDGFVKSIECQKKFVQNRGREPYVIRYISNRVEEVIEKLDANWSPTGRGSAFIVPLSEDTRPLGILVFLGRYQNRQYVNQPIFYLGSEKRRSSLYHLKYFRSLQPFIAREYFKLKLEDKQRIVAKMENIMSALKEIIHIENRNEVLDRLAEFTAKSLGCAGCLIHLLNSAQSHLYVAAASGFQSHVGLKDEVIFPLQASYSQRQSPPAQIFGNKNEMIANSDREFARLSGKQNPINPFFKQLKSGKVISYLGRPIGNLGVIEVFNKSKLTPSGWSFFEDQDSITLRHISDVIATVLRRMEATASQVQSEKVKVTSELLLDISHELKNPLYSSLIFVRKLKSTLNGQILSNGENGALQTLGLIERNVEKAQRILAGMQNFQTSMTQTKRESVNLEKIMRVVLQTNASFCEQQRITAGSEFLAEEPLVFGDELQLNQVFTNLVKNAIDAMPNGGMLTVRLYELDGTLQVEIADTGSGIPDAIKDRVFEPFVTTKKPESGTGLGLALSQRIIKQHQGKIEFETELGWGTKFLVTLPKFVEPAFAPVIARQTVEIANST